MSCYALVVAAGSGTRMSAARPKQFLSVGSVPILAITLLRISRFAFIDGIVVAVPKNEIPFCEESVIRAFAIPKIVSVIQGGATRQESVFNGLHVLADKSPEHVVIHDGVRPLFSTEMFEAVVASLQNNDAVIPGLPVFETMKEIDNNHCVVATVDREKIRAIQTPQGFRFKKIWDAHMKLREAHTELTDDAMVMEFYGEKVKVIDGSRNNIKITTPDDLEYAEHIFEKHKERFNL